MLERLTRSNAPAAVLLVRIAVGWIFLSEGTQKFLYPDLLGAGRFARIGIPAPELVAPFVGGLEIACAALVLLGLFTRVAALLLLTTISVAILSTKIPILLGHGYWIFSLPRVSRYGFWGMSSEVRTDLSMFLGAAFLVIVGAGPVSADHLLFRTPGLRALR
jgi:putative oxidoreductase